MFPVSGPLLGAAFSLASRALSGEIELSKKQRERLEAGRERIDELSEIVGNLSPTEPGTWGRFAGRVMDHAFETSGRADSAEDWRKQNGFTARLKVPGVFVQEMLAGREQTSDDGTSSEPAVVYEDNEHVIRLLKLPGEAPLALVSDSEKRKQTLECYFAPSLTPRAAIREAFAAAFWEGRTSGRVDYGANSLTYRDTDLSQFVYRGERLQLIDLWREFIDQGVARSVLLQGAPGTGKTTLSCHTARELSKRTLLLGSDALGELDSETWDRMLETLQPEALIVDDIDHAIEGGGYHRVNRALRLFGEQGHTVPLVLFTSNDYTKLPEAMRRPGRIDQIVRFDEPSDQIRVEIVEELAEELNVDLPDAHRGWLVDLMEEYSVAHVQEAIKRAKVQGWGAAAQAGEETFRMHRDFDNLQEWLQVHGFRRFDDEASFIIEEVCERSDMEVAYKDDHEGLNRLELPNGAQLCIEEGNGRWAVAGARFRADVYYRADYDGRDAVAAGIAELFWQGREEVMLDAVEGNFICRGADALDHPYYGPLLEKLDLWERFREADIRRSVLLQGPPGCGKSTFCRHAARELSARTLLLTPDFYESIRAAQWKIVDELLQPEMVIVDDIDRVGSHALESKLRLFEEQFCDIPYILFTSNDMGKLPAPMRRPGRIDEIIEVRPPEQSVRWTLIRKMGERVGVEVPDEQLQRLDELLQNHSPAHLLETLRRAKIQGWDADPFPGDLTFEDEEGRGEGEPGYLQGHTL